MALRDLDIDIDLDVDASGLAAANAQIDSMVNKIESIPDTIRINVDMDGINTALTQVQALQTQVNTLDHTDIDIDIDLDNAAVQAQLAALQAQLNNMDNDDVDIDIHTDFASTLAQLETLEAQVNELDRDDIFINFDLDTHTNDILALRAHLRLLEQQARHIDVDLDTAGAHAQLALLQAHINGIRGPNTSSVASGLTGLLSNLNPVGLMVGGGMAVAGISALLVVLPPLAVAANVAIGAIASLAVALGTLAGGALAFASALSVGAIGLVGFGAVAVSNISALYQEGAKLTTQQQQLKAQTDKVATSWGNLKTAMQPTVLSATTSGVKAINTLLSQSQPIFKSAGTAVETLMGNFNKSLKGNEMQGFFAMLKRDVKPVTESLGNGLGNALKGVGNALTAFSPLTRWASSGFESLMQKFSGWTQKLVGSGSMDRFSNYIQTNFGKIGGGLLDGIKGLGKTIGAFSGIGAEGFTWFQDKMKQFNTWSSGLGNNSGFQSFLSSIRENAPAVGRTLKELGGILSTFWSVMTAPDSNGGSRLQSFADGLTSISNALKDQNLQNVISGAFTFDMSRIFNGLTGGAVNGGFGDNLEGQIEQEVSSSVDNGLNKGFSTGISKFTPTGLAGNALSGITEKLFNVNLAGDTTATLIPKATLDAMAQNTIRETESVLSGKGTTFQNAAQKQLENLMGGGSEGGKGFKIKVDADTTPAQTAMKSMTAEEIQAKVDADTATAQSKLDALDATPIKIETDTSAIAANIGNMVATVQLNADTSTITNSIQNMPNARVKVTADTASLTNSIGNLPDARISLKADTIKITNNIAPVNVPANLSSINTSGLGPVKLPITPMFAGGGSGINFNWPPMPKFTFPSLPKFSWPAMPKFSWPALPKWTWPPMPKFSWPPFPRFSWPPMPTVKVNVSGGKTDGSHANGLGRVSHDGYTATLHKNESVLQAHNAQALRDAGVLRGDGTSPTVDLSAVSSSAPVATATAAHSGNRQATYHINLGGIHVSANGGDPDQIASKIREGINEFFESVQDVMPPVMEV